MDIYVSKNSQCIQQRRDGASLALWCNVDWLQIWMQENGKEKDDHRSAQRFHWTQLVKGQLHLHLYTVQYIEYLPCCFCKHHMMSFLKAVQWLPSLGRCRLWKVSNILCMWTFHFHFYFQNIYCKKKLKRRKQISIEKIFKNLSRFVPLTLEVWSSPIGQSFGRESESDVGRGPKMAPSEELAILHRR